jgi:DNA-binding PucR family transcriptional regulator
MRTLNAYFCNPGNASEAARELHIHPNTFRYRMAKVADLLGLDLEDRDTRLIVELELLRHRFSD